MKNGKLKISDIEPDSRNANRGTARGLKMITASLHEDGFGRSGLLDKNNKIIAGNKTTDASSEVFGAEQEIVVVDSDGTKPIYVRRTDLDLDSDVAARRLAYRDNLSSVYGFEIEVSQVLADMESGFDFDAIGVGQNDLSQLLEGALESDFDFSDLNDQLEELEGMEEVEITITVPAQYKEQVTEWLSNGEYKTRPGMGKGVLKRCGLL